MKCFQFLCSLFFSLLFFVNPVFSLSITASTRSVVGVPSLVVWTREPPTDGTGTIAFDLRFVQVDPEQDVGLALANMQLDAGQNFGTGMVTFPAAGGFTLKAVAGSPRNTLIGTSNAVLAVVLNDPATSTSTSSGAASSTLLPPATSGISTAIPTATDGTSSSSSDAAASSTVLPSSASSSPSTTKLPSDALSAKRTPNVPAIVGGIVGAILLLSLLAILFVFLHRRRKTIKKRLTFHRDMMVQRRLSRHPPTMPASAPPSMTQLVGPPTMIRVTRPSGESARTESTENPFEPEPSSEVDAARPKSMQSMVSGVTSESAYSVMSEPSSGSTANAHGHTPLAMPTPIVGGGVSGALVPVRRRTPSPPPILPPIQAHAASFSLASSSSSSSHSHAPSSDIDLEQGLASPYPDVPTDVSSAGGDIDLEAAIARPIPVPAALMTSPRGPRPSIRRAAPPIPPTPGSAPPVMPVASSSGLPTTSASDIPLPPSAPPSASTHSNSHSHSQPTITKTTTTSPPLPPLHPQRTRTPRQQTLALRISMLQSQMREMHERRGDASTKNLLVEMQREMVWLREQENSAWALGQTDVLPPGHARYMTP